MVLQQNGDWLLGNPQYNIRIEGHCDERGTIEYNLALGERRASAVRDYLVSLGVDAFRIRIVSYGEEDPADPGHDEAAWARNRRGVFVIES
jgi:peptidoglycan-associated lipoprotein